MGDPAGYCVPVGKRRTQAKEWALSPRQCDFKSVVCAVSSPVNVTFCPSTSIRYCERVRFKGQRTQPQVDVRRLLANACVFPCNALFVIESEKTGTPRDTVYPWGKGVNKQKTNKQINCVCLVKSAVCDVAFGGCLQTLALCAVNYLKSFFINADR